MNKTIEIMIDDVIREEIGNLSSLEAGSKEKSAAVEDLKKLCELQIEAKKVDDAAYEKVEELDLKQKQLDQNKLDRWINIGLQIGLTAASLIAYDIWYRRGLHFEETGTVRVPMTRNLLSKMLPGRK